MGAVGVSFQRAAPKFVHCSNHAPWTPALVPFKAGKGERPWDEAFSGLSMGECRAATQIECVPDRAALRKETPTAPVRSKKVRDRRSTNALPIPQSRNSSS